MPQLGRLSIRQSGLSVPLSDIRSVRNLARELDREAHERAMKDRILCGRSSQSSLNRN